MKNLCITTLLLLFLSTGCALMDETATRVIENEPVIRTVAEVAPLVTPLPLGYMITAALGGILTTAKVYDELRKRNLKNEST